MTEESNNMMRRACDDEAALSGKRVAFGVAAVLIGCLFLFQELGYISRHSAGHWWTMLLCVFGLNALLFSDRIERKISGCLQIFIGFWMFACLEHLWGWTFSVTWPMILIALGLCYIGSHLFKLNDHNNGNGS